jgi:hypothetical protein
VPLLASDVTINEFGEASTPAPSNTLVAWEITQESGHEAEAARDLGGARKRRTERANAPSNRLLYEQLS